MIDKIMGIFGYFFIRENKKKSFLEVKISLS